jgi:predicted AAA+ superfamily ATPase
VGKSTLARQVFAAGGSEGRYFDLEDPDDLGLLQHPKFTLAPLRGLVVIDEVQRRPELFPTLRVLADRPVFPARFLVLGSASPELLRQSSESLAGRIAFHELPGFSLADVGASSADHLWVRGGFPGSYLAPDDARSARWRAEFVQTFLQRDLPGLGVTIPAAVLERFWAMLAHGSGQVWTGSDFASSLGVAESTVRRYLDLLQSTFAVTVLRPWHENLKKRQVKSPKVYVSDSGLLHSLLRLRTAEEVERHPKAGPSWEGFALSSVIRHLRAWKDECYFWRTHTGAELDLLVVRGLKRYGFEFKRTSSPDITKSMHIALSDLKLDELVVVHAGKESFPLTKGMRAVAFQRILKDLKPVR